MTALKRQTYAILFKFPSSSFYSLPSHTKPSFQTIHILSHCFSTQPCYICFYPEIIYCTILLTLKNLYKCNQVLCFLKNFIFSLNLIIMVSIKLMWHITENNSFYHYSNLYLQNSILLDGLMFCNLFIHSSHGYWNISIFLSLFLGYMCKYMPTQLFLKRSHQIYRKQFFIGVSIASFISST